MHKSSMVLAGLAVALAGATAVAAERANEHVLSVRLPDGGIEHVRYTGDVAPRIVVQPVAVIVPAGPAAPFAAAFGPDSPFAQMDRISAEMDAQADAMMRQVSAIAAQPASHVSPRMAAMAAAPAGATYRYVSTTTVNGKTCTTSVQSVAQGAGKAPQLLRQVSGDCGTAMQRPAGPIPAAAPLPPATPGATLAVAPAAPKPPVVPADTI